MKSRVVGISVAWLLVAGAGCHRTTHTPATTAAPEDAGRGADSGADSSVDASDAIDQFAITEPPANSLSRQIDYQTDSRVLTDVEIDCGDAYSERFKGDTKSRMHGVLVLGLAGATQCEVRIRVDGAVVHMETFDVVAPDDWPNFEVVFSKPSKVQTGWTLFNLANVYDAVPARIAVVDSLGRLRWYYELPTTQSGGDTVVATVQEGVLACGRLGNDGPFVVGWDGVVLWQPRLVDHHDCSFTDDTETVFRHLIDAKSCAGQPGAGAVVEVDRNSGEQLWEWAICEHYNPPNLVSDWSHLNAVLGFPGEDALLVSSRNQNALLKVSHETGDVLWQLGGGGDFDHDAADTFWAQHAPEIEPDGHILMFDNGRVGERESSRVIEIAYDEKAMTYEVVWEYAPSPPRFNEIWGDADRLPNGNTLTTFGVNSRTDTSDLYEVDPNGNLVWQLHIPARWGVYRADRIDEQHGFVRE